MPAIRFATLIGVLWMAACAIAWGQEGGAAASRYYNVKAGPVDFTLSSGITTEYTDNINLSNGTVSPIESELTINPQFGIEAVSQLQVTPLSETNVSTMSLRMNFGYKDYVFHPELNQNTTNIDISPDSEISFLVRAGHFSSRIHDGFGLETDPTAAGSLSNVAQFRRFTNTFGLDNRWQMNSNTAFELDYTHRNVYALDLVSLNTSGSATNLSTSNLTNASDSLSALAQTKALSPFLTLGMKGSVTQTDYPNASDQNSTSYSYGPFTDLQLTEYTSLNASTGITKTQSGGAIFTGTGGITSGGSSSDSTTQYANLALTNRMNMYYTQTFSIGRETALSLLGSQTETNYARYESQWKVNSKIALAIGLFSEDTTDLGVAGAAAHYRRDGATLSTGYQLSRKLSTNLVYRYLKKNSDDPTQSYQQNTVTWSLDYRF